MSAATATTAVVLSYLLGAVPTGLWLGLALRGIDIRRHGSKNIGATNTLRVLGKRLGVAALVCDVGKGAIPVLLIARLSDWPYAPAACGLAAIIGHLAPVYVGFRGGKGVATSAGVFLALCPPLFVAALTAFIAGVTVTRMVSVGSIAAALTMAVAALVVPSGWATYPTHLVSDGRALRVLVVALGALVILRHRANIRRMLRGEESRM